MVSIINEEGCGLRIAIWRLKGVGQRLEEEACRLRKAFEGW